MGMIRMRKFSMCKTVLNLLQGAYLRLRKNDYSRERKAELVAV